MRLLALVALAAIVALPGRAEAQADGRWAAWLGCWELVDENVRDAEATVFPRPRASAPAPRSPETTPRVCATAAENGSATFTTTIAGETALSRTVVPDGTDRPVDDTECRGTQREEFSQDGARVFTFAQLTCANDRSPRRVSGLSFLGPNGNWIDIQAVEIGGREDVRVRRYRRVEQAPAAGVPTLVATRLTIDDIKEASGKISPRALEAALLETGTAFELDGHTLLELDDAGVAGSVVDVMVALSYPDRFVVERARDGGRSSTVFLSDPFGIDYGFYSPLYGSLYYPYYYSPFAYSYYGRFDPRFFGGGVVFVPVDPGSGDDGPAEPPASGAARAVDGSGYTRVRPRSPEPETSPVATGRRVGGRTTAATDSGSAGSSGSSGSSSGSSGGSGGTASSGGFSSGGGGDTGRTAVPR